MIVCALVDGERSVRDLEDTLGIRQPGLSQQIAELRGWLHSRPQGSEAYVLPARRRPGR
jgi:DNA-binding transcriptional LysR family regulator